MIMLNTVILMGRLTADPELRYTPQNTPVTSFTLAVERNFTPQDGARETDFFNIVAWRKTAEFAARYFGKGQTMAVRGSLQTRKYTDRDGNNRTAFEVTADSVYFTGTKVGAPEENFSGRCTNVCNTPPVLGVLVEGVSADRPPDGTHGAELMDISADDDLPF